MIVISAIAREARSRRLLGCLHACLAPAAGWRPSPATSPDVQAGQPTAGYCLAAGTAHALSAPPVTRAGEAGAAGA